MQETVLFSLLIYSRPPQMQIQISSLFYLLLLLPGICHGSVEFQDFYRVLDILDAEYEASNFECKKNPVFDEIGSNPMVKTNSGTIVGKYVNISGINEVASFLRIPYAKPPLGEYRFKQTDPVEPWEGILEANEVVPPCMQYFTDKAMWQSPYQPTEDCLFLNIFVPTKYCCAEYGELQVLVWIYGGSFSHGSSASFDGSILANNGRVIVVTINYRLGVFGLLNGGIGEAPGNAAMFDQVLAIKWVRENIALFGGDPNKITLFGQSSGGISVGLHMISPLSRNLFYRGIMESGSAYSPTYTDIPDTSREKANAIANAVKCANSSFNMDTHPKEVVQCLKKMDALVLAEAENVLRPPINALYFKPSIHNEFLPEHPIEAFDSGDFAPVEVLMGNMKDEVSPALAFVSQEIFPTNQEPTLNLSTAINLLPTFYEIMPKSILKQVSNFYLKGIAEDDSPAIVEALKNGLGDFMLVCPTFLLAEKLNNPYVYWWTYISPMDPNADWVGAYHEYEIPYVFGVPFLMPQKYTLEDRKFSSYIIHEWTHFAKTGNPLENKRIPRRKRWFPFSPSTAASFELSADNRHTIPFPRREACEFWRPIFASFPTR